MACKFKLVVSRHGDALTEKRLRAAIQKGGGRVVHVDSASSLEEGCDETLIVKVDDLQRLPRIIFAIEGVKGVAVREVCRAEREGRTQKV